MYVGIVYIILKHNEKHNVQNTKQKLIDMRDTHGYKTRTASYDFPDGLPSAPTFLLVYRCKSFTEY